MKKSIVLSVYMPTLLLEFCRGLLIPVMPLYVASFEVSFVSIGLVLGSEGLGTLLGDMPAGILAGRTGFRRAMLIGIGFVMLSALFMSWTQTLRQLAVLYFLNGVAGALWKTSRLAYLANAVPLQQRGRVIATFGGVHRIGLLAGPVIGGAFGAAFGLRTTFGLYAALAAFAFIFPAISSMDAELTNPEVYLSTNRQSRDILATLKSNLRVFFTAGAGQLFAQLIRSSRHVIIPLYAASVLGLGVRSIGWIVGVGGIVDFCMFYPAGFIMDRYGRKFAYVPSFLIQAIGMAIIPLAVGALGLFLSSSILGLGNGLGSGTMATLGADLAPQEISVEFLGVWRLIGDAGTTGGPVLLGGFAELLGISLAAVVMAGFGVLAAVDLGFFVPETLVTYGS